MMNCPLMLLICLIEHVCWNQPNPGHLKLVSSNTCKCRPLIKRGLKMSFKSMVMIYKLLACHFVLFCSFIQSFRHLINSLALNDIKRDTLFSRMTGHCVKHIIFNFPFPSGQSKTSQNKSTLHGLACNVILNLLLNTVCLPFSDQSVQASCQKQCGKKPTNSIYNNTGVIINLDIVWSNKAEI